MLALAAVLLLGMPDEGDFVKLKNGDRVRLLGIRDNLGQKSWNAAGIPAKVLEPSFAEYLGEKTVRPNPTNILAPVFQIERGKRAGVPDSAFLFGSKMKLERPAYVLLEPVGMNRDIWLTSQSNAFGGATSSDIWIGVADGAWATQGRVNYKSGRLASQTGSRFATRVVLENKRSMQKSQTLDGKVVRWTQEPTFRVEVDLPSVVHTRSFRVVAYDTKVRSFSSGGQS